ncbi:MAG: response regulator transcription factor [Chloroflexota bacterium]
MSGPRVLVIDDEPGIRRALRLVLQASGYQVDVAATGDEGLDLAASHPPELIILDLSLRDRDGVEVCRSLREWSQAPVIVLSVHDDDASKVRALDNGADDYVTKPFSVPELLARMRVALRHAHLAGAGEAAKQTVQAGDVVIDFAHRTVSKGEREVHVTPTEYGLLRYLAQHAGRVISHGQLLRTVLGPGYQDAYGSLRVHIAAIRKKIETDPSAPQIIVTEPGVGYRLRAD